MRKVSETGVDSIFPLTPTPPPGNGHFYVVQGSPNVIAMIRDPSQQLRLY